MPKSIMKPFIFVTIFVLITAATVIAMDTSIFLKWWEDSAYSDEHSRPPHGVRLVNVPFKKIPKAEVNEIDLPLEFQAKRWMLLELSRAPDIPILLLVPTETPADGAIEPSCQGEKSWLRLSGSKTWTSVKLNPYCSDTYGPDEVDIQLFWLQNEDYPFIEVVTNHPAYVPVYLYQFNTMTRAFVQIKALYGT